MPGITVVVGLLLCGLSLVTYGISGEVKSVSIFIPAFVGGPLALLGVVSMLAPGARKHAMHVAVLLGLIGGLLALGRGVGQLFKLIGGGSVETLPLVMVWAMAILCIVFVFLCIQSFIAARRNRVENQGSKTV